VIVILLLPTTIHPVQSHTISSHSRNESPVLVLVTSLSVTSDVIVYNHHVCTSADVGKSPGTSIAPLNCIGLSRVIEGNGLFQILGHCILFYVKQSKQVHLHYHLQSMIHIEAYQQREVRKIITLQQT